VGWIAGGFLTISRGLTREARVRAKPALAWGAATLALFALWIFALMNA